MGAPDLLRQVKKQLLSDLSLKDPDVQVQIRRDSFGWLRLSVITAAFEKMDEESRVYQLDKILAPLHLRLDDYPFATYRLLTPQEAAQQPALSPVQLPLWSEILMAPEPAEPAVVNENKPGPLVVTFYSFKGGVGRTTALAFVASRLVTRGYRVVVIDFDLEAPGLSFLQTSPEQEAGTIGVLDYIYQRYITPDQHEPSIKECIRPVPLSARGELYLLAAGAYDEEYIHKLADLSVRSLYQSEVNPIQELLQDVKSTLNPDVILIDARTGFTEMGAVALFDQADLGIICFSPTQQSYAGLEWVVKAASKQKKYNGIPDLRFLLTPMPPVARVQQEEWLGRAADWITEHWDIPSSLTVDELYYHVPYNPNILTLDSFFIDVPEHILKSYEPLADMISAGVPEKLSGELVDASTTIVEQRHTILDELIFESPTAQDIDRAKIPTIFQRTEDFGRFLSRQHSLVLGAKGTGKTLLFRLFIEQSSHARNLAIPYKADLSKVSFVPGHGRAELRSTLLVADSLADYEKATGAEGWSSFWPNYLLLQLAITRDIHLSLADPFLMSARDQKHLSQQHIVQWLEQRLQMPHAASQTLDELKKIDAWLGTQGQKIWVLYDELDTGFGQKERRRRALDALFDWWSETGSSFTNISPKIFLRSDIWTGLNFTNKTRYATVILRWDEEDLWKLVLRQALTTSKTFAEILQKQVGFTINFLETRPQEVLRKALFLLWGERMGRTNKAYTYNWIIKRIGDYKDNRFPRSLIQLLQEAIKNEKDALERNPTGSPSEAVLRPRSLIDALPFVSKQRVDEVRNEYREFETYLAKLANERSPITLDRLQEIWELDSIQLKDLVAQMVEAGILREYPYPPRIQGNDPPRYSVAELYLSGLGMTRLGQR